MASVTTMTTMAAVAAMLAWWARLEFLILFFDVGNQVLA
jgi:hypothetical protein